MREILFRGKCVDSGEWIYGSFIPDLLEVYQNVPGKWLGDWGFIKPFGKTKEERLMVEVERETIGQYIGLTDKNGVKIFEGDVVRIPSFKPALMLIGFIEGAFCLTNSEKEFIADIHYIHHAGINEAEVIGNIHDNPELLENRKI